MVGPPFISLDIGNYYRISCVIYNPAMTEDRILNTAATSLKVWHLVAIFVVANLATALPTLIIDYDTFYASTKQPSFAPPTWLFAPMWLFLNITSLIALRRIVSLPNSPARRTVILAEIWALIAFAIFGSIYLWLQSNILSALDTVFMLICTAISVKFARSLDTWSFALLLPRLAWLSVAGLTGVFIAVMNGDSFFQRLIQ